MHSDKTNLRSKDQSMLAVVYKVLKKSGWSFEHIEDVDGFKIYFKNQQPPVIAFAYTIEVEERFLFYIEFIERCCQEKLNRVSEFINRVNCGINIGNFEMNFLDGGVSYKSSIDLRQTVFEEILFANAILAAMDAVEVYGQALHNVMIGHQLPMEAIDEIESKVKMDK